MKKIFATLFISFLTACSTNNTKTDTDYYVEKILSQKQSPIVFKAEPTPILVSIKSPKDIKLDKKINISISKPINIIAAIDFADNTLSISPDAGVDLNKRFIVNFKNQALGNYFNYLENITGYSIKLLDGVVYIKSINSKTWDLQTLSMNSYSIESNSKSELSSDGSAPVVSDNINQTWQNIVTQIKAIMATENNNTSNQESENPLSNISSSKAPAVVITDNQQLGTISVINGLPAKIKQVDKWIEQLIQSSNRQIHLQVQVLDVTVDESVGQGINWNLISKQSSQFQVGNNAKQTIDGAGMISIGTPAGALINLGKKITLDIMLDLLAKQGKVRVDNQPNITVTNGREAYITTGDQFSYISAINSTPDDAGNVITTSEIDRMDVGVDMRVTPKILPDNRIVVSIVPIVSSLKSYTTLTSGSGSSIQEFKTPDIALQKLTTQVIVDSGKTIHLGGLIASKVANAAKGLPGGGIMDVFFRGVQKSLERREIVILVTPTIVR